MESDSGVIPIDKNQQTDKTFNRLKELQDLLKKESALKELCKKILNKNII